MQLLEFLSLKSNLFLKPRAKDVPADRAQFAHTDIFILLTYLSYYYGGLNDEQLNEVFNILDKDKDRKEEYAKWIRYIPNTVSIDNSIKVYESLNLSDYTQKILFVFPLLRKHPLVVNYWASHVLFPNEAIEFDGKISKYFVLYIFNKHFQNLSYQFKREYF